MSSSSSSISSSSLPLRFISIDSLDKTSLPKSDQTCGICLKPIDIDNEYGLACTAQKIAHLFHRKCLNRWLKTGKDNCPTCRASIMPTIYDEMIWRIEGIRSTSNHSASNHPVDRETVFLSACHDGQEEPALKLFTVINVSWGTRGYADLAARGLLEAATGGHGALVEKFLGVVEIQGDLITLLIALQKAVVGNHAFVMEKLLETIVANHPSAIFLEIFRHAILQETLKNTIEQTSPDVLLVSINNNEGPPSVLEALIHNVQAMRILLEVASKKDLDSFVAAALSSPSIQDDIECLSSALEEASRRGHVSVVKVLLTTKIQYDNEALARALREAASEGHSAVVETLLTTGVRECNQAVFIALQEAARQGHTSAVVALYATDIRYDNQALPMVLREAASRGHLSVIEAVLPPSLIEDDAAIARAITEARRHNQVSVIELFASRNDLGPKAKLALNKVIQSLCKAELSRATPIAWSPLST